MSVPPTLHATAVAIGGHGILLLGGSGAGKSDLAWRLMDRGAVLIADDRVVARPGPGGLHLSPPERLAGLMELRGVGIQQIGHVCDVPALLAFDLEAAPERLPLPQVHEIAGVSLPLFGLQPFEASAPLKLERIVALWLQDGLEAFDADARFRRG